MDLNDAAQGTSGRACKEWRFHETVILLLSCSPKISSKWCQAQLSCMECCAGDKRKSMRAGGVLWEGMGLHEDLKRLRLVRGLSNDSGLNNCFLNVVIQGVWHLRSFREALLNLRPQVRPPSDL